MNDSIDSQLIEKVARLPENPGVYIMRDCAGKIIYVGKAINLKNRARSYFNTSQEQSFKIVHMVPRINDIEYFITATEEEALILELNLIKRHKPYYNVRLKDDKTFPYLKISLNEDYPRVQITRKLEDDGARYFGPFSSAYSVRQTLKTIKEIFPFRSCSIDLNKKIGRPCLEYDIHKCPGPCINAVSREEYTESIKRLILFLEGKQEKVVRQLENSMQQAVSKLEYEKAAILRDRIKAVKEVINWQKLATTVKGEQDVIAFAQDKDMAYAQVFFIRGSRIIGREGFAMQGTQSEEPGQVMTDFVKQFYSSATYVPSLILLQYPITDKAVIESWLGKKRGSAVQIQSPVRGNKKQLVETVAVNARRGLDELKIKQISSQNNIDTAMEELQQVLDMPSLPLRIEGYDISNIQGKSAVGSMVVFEKGRPKTSHYRRFKIKTLQQPNDFAMMQEVIKRRFGRYKDTNKEPANTWGIIPDLILIDGGKGQLNSVMEALKETGIYALTIIGLAKENEEIFTPGASLPIILPKSSPALQLLQRIRDESHRFAIGYHHNLHKKQTFVSALEAVPGIGPTRKKALLKKFGSVAEIKEASVEELSSVNGITPPLAQKIKQYL
ncbi:MAG: excinuclease ABC subunit UvrC [Dehalococcoidales bacterium]|nr:excinuclease ABC subunit UvrC [Dehalococcoidales bacterium]